MDLKNESRVSRGKNRAKLFFLGTFCPFSGRLRQLPAVLSSGMVRGFPRLPTWSSGADVPRDIFVFYRFEQWTDDRAANGATSESLSKL